MLSSSPSSSSEKRWNYDVFLSFRGEDTCDTFCSHLSEALKRSGIHTFIDDEKLERGRETSVELRKAIEESRIWIVVLSENYASSAWCLRELVWILQCWWLNGRTVLPVFYNVDKWDVRKQRGSFGEAFAKHEADGKIESVHVWKEALTSVGNLSGYEYPRPAHRPEGKLIREIVECILKDLAKDHTSFSIVDHLGGTSNDVRTSGIWVASGIGETIAPPKVYVNYHKYSFGDNKHV